MPVHLHDAPFERLGKDELAAWQGAEAAAVSDCLDRSMAMDAGMSPLDPGMHVVGHARTVRCMAADNGALHAALTVLAPGEVLVAEAGGYLGNAVWGGLMTEAARRSGVAGLILDGAVRDTAEIVAAGFPCFARGATPAGPHKGFGGAIDVPIACGGVAVRPGDLIVADADGVAVVPLERAEAVLAAYRALKAKEAGALAALDAGGTLAEIYGVPEITRVASR
ncbi:MAG: RraA family protein [Pseudomonadota bacterium]